MDWTDEMIRMCARPTGELGRIIAEEMNECHYELWKWGLSHMQIPESAVIIDIGCGGGGAIKLLNSLSPHSRINGIDISEDMVALSRQTNDELIKQAKVKITCGNVSSIPYPDNTFDLAAAFESDYFWPDLKNDFREVLRCLKPGGTLIIVDEVYTHEFYDERNSQWAELTGCSFCSPEEYRRLISGAGFTSVEIIEIPERNWITIIASKP
jgi:SAM-dependent methyltransferase